MDRQAPEHPGLGIRAGEGHLVDATLVEGEEEGQADEDGIGGSGLGADGLTKEVENECNAEEGRHRHDEDGEEGGSWVRGYGKGMVGVREEIVATETSSGPLAAGDVDAAGLDRLAADETLTPAEAARLHTQALNIADPRAVDAWVQAVVARHQLRKPRPNST